RVADVARGPAPALDIPEARRADEDSVLLANDGERHRGAGTAPSQRGIDVAGDLGLALGDRTPLVERWIGGTRRDDTVDVAEVERFETNVSTGEGWSV